MGAAEAGAYARVTVERGALERSLERSTIRDLSVGERAPLLGPGSRAGSKTRMHRKGKSGPPVGTASVTQATLMVRYTIKIYPSKPDGIVVVEGIRGDGYTIHGEGVSLHNKLGASYTNADILASSMEVKLTRIG